MKRKTMLDNLIVLPLLLGCAVLAHASIIGPLDHAAAKSQTAQAAKPVYLGALEPVTIRGKRLRG